MAKRQTGQGHRHGRKCAARSIATYPGSGEILSRTLVAFCSPTKGLVQASPTYDNPTPVAKFLNVPIASAPLTPDYRHDVKAMLKANPNGGVYYVVNPNNPTGTMTPMAEIEWLVNNKPAGAVVLIDEAYIHWTKDYPNKPPPIWCRGQGRGSHAHLLQSVRHGRRAGGVCAGAARHRQEGGSV